ncbi:hypothetical protein EPH_0032960 [Eimeria praecox]|uniref:Uncharacterized protein n=1 Tax=Eimeria praecox TaxID=51316 RepID=U6G4A4_9EIME|nr:hypothetical protein EPH_0032960 [Eimeria praecox]
MGNRLHRTAHDDEGGAFTFSPGGLHQGFLWGGSRRRSRAPERPPAIEESSEAVVPQGDAVSQDWRWLALRCERRLNASLQQRSAKHDKIVDTLGHSLDVKQFSCFVPRTVLEAIADKRIRSATTTCCG